MSPTLASIRGIAESEDEAEEWEGLPPWCPSSIANEATLSISGEADIARAGAEDRAILCIVLLPNLGIPAIA